MSLKGRKIMVTSGGTREYIDEVRVITNISTGALGSVIAEELYKCGAEIFYVHGKQAYKPQNYNSSEGILSCYEIVTVNDLMEKMKKLISTFDIDTVIHSAAVSDFTFKRDKSIKISSNNPEALIEYMGKTITKTPKIINHIREWNPNIILIGFKFTVGSLSIVENARDFLKMTQANMIIANDKEEMNSLKIHRAHIVTDTADLYRSVNGKKAIAQEIINFLEKLGENNV